VQQGLALARATVEIARRTVPLDLPHMPAHCPPPLDLPQVYFRHLATHKVPAIPLKSAARIIWMKPSFFRQTESGRLASTPK